MEKPRNLPPEERRNISSQTRLIWPDNESLIRQKIERIRAEREVNPRNTTLFRGITSELEENEIGIEEATGLPRLTGRKLRSHAYRMNGWRAVGRAFQDSSGDLTSLIPQSDARDVLSPLIWTSENPNTAFSFGAANLEVLLIIRPDPTRLKLRSNFPGSFSKEQNEQFEEAIQQKRPFVLDLPAYNVLPDQEEAWHQTLLGPYIEYNEIDTLIRVSGENKEEFSSLIRDLFPYTS